MQGTAERDLALDVDDLAAAQPHPRGDAARNAERKTAQADDREPVDLADRGAPRLDADRLARDLLLQPSIDAVAAPDFGVDRRLHLALADRLAGIGGKLVGLAQ